MTFTIPPFWCGVIATILGEFIALVVYAVVKNVKDKRNSTFRRK
jgi:hypothetical protein